MGNRLNGATQQLQWLAERAAQQSPRAREGPFAYVHTVGVAQVSSYLVVNAKGSLRKRDEWVERGERELWVARDGGGRIEETTDGQRTEITGVYGPGKLYPVVPVSTDPDELEQYIAPRCNAGTYSWLKSVKHVWNERVIESALQSALLTVLARKPNIVWLGAVSDPLGRSGVVIATDKRRFFTRRRYILIFDPDTGMLLAQETRYDSPTSTGDPVRYSAFLTSGYVSTTDARPEERS